MGKVGGGKGKGAGAGAGKASPRNANQDPATVTVYSDGTSSWTPGGKGLKHKPIKRGR